MNEGEVILFGDGGREINDDFPGIFIASVLPIAGGSCTKEVTTCTSFGVCILFRCVKSTQYPPGFTGLLTVADEARF
jgi:hypothetical protein